MTRRLLPLIALALVALACEETFSPKGPFTRQLVVYSVLTNQSDSQYVRVFTTYDPPSFDPYGQPTDTPVLGASVTMDVDGSTIGFREFALPRPDHSRFADSVHAYIAEPMALQRGKVYRLTVQTADLGTLQGETSVPQPGVLMVNNRYVLEAPGTYLEDLSVSAQLSSMAYGFLIRIFIDYEVFQGGVWTRYREEVPQRVSGDASSGTLQVEYPRLTRRQNDPRSTLPGGTTVFTGRAYRWLIGSISSRYALVPMRFQNAICILYQTDLPLYVYYSLANGFQDEFSIRTDAPDYSNLQGGFGVFGSLTSDTLFVPLPESVR